MSLPSQGDEDFQTSSLRWSAIAKEMLMSAIVAILIVVCVNIFTGRSFVSGDSMLSTLNEDEHVLIWKPAYWSSPPNRGDIVVFHHPLAGSRDLVKRVIGLPGETLRISGGDILINGEMLGEHYSHGTSAPDGLWEIPQDSVFVMGDNREFSSDSRVFGYVPVEKIVGRVVLVFYPLRDLRVIDSPEYLEPVTSIR
jgi:signal peptidase I